MKNHLLVGSRALEFWGLGFTASPLSDWDIICPEEDRYVYQDLRVDTSFLNELNNADIVQEFSSGITTDIGGIEVEVCTPKGLAVLKRSHLWRDYKWDRHITQYHFCFGDKGLSGLLYRDYHKELARERQKLTLKAYPQGNPKLNQSNEEFFDDAVKKEFDHDWIHELVAYGKRPMYTRLKSPEKTDLAWCEGDLWERLSHIDKLRCVAEETTVIACERFMIPSNWMHGERRAYAKALKKVCTTLCSGWFRDFAIDNYPAVMDMFDITRFRYVKEKTYDH